MKPVLGIAALAFFSLMVFGAGVFLHLSPVTKPAGVSAMQPVPSAHHGKKKPTARAGAAKAASSSAATPENSLAFPLMAGGGTGLLIAAIAGLGLCRSLLAAAAQPSRRLLEAEQAARKKQQADLAAQTIAFQSQKEEAEQRKAEMETMREQVSRQFQEFFRTLPVACFCFAANGRIIRWNAACEALYGIPAAAALESTIWDTIVPESQRGDAEAKISRVLSGESLLGDERWDTVAGGGTAHLRCSMVPLYDAEGHIIGGLSAGVEVSEVARNEPQITAPKIADLTTNISQVEMTSQMLEECLVSASLAITTSTELSGHPAFRARLTEEMERAVRYHASVSLVLLDLDGFGAWNRAFGYAAGDEALQSAVAVIKSKVRSVDIIARLGADEYAVILPETGEAGVRVAAERLRSGLSGISTGSRPPLTACFGAAQLSSEVSDAEELVTRALRALQHARSCGANTIVHYQDMQVSVEPEGDTASAPVKQKRGAGRAAKSPISEA